jgi:hypothetical protein
MTLFSLVTDAAAVVVVGAKSRPASGGAVDTGGSQLHPSKVGR